MKILAIECSATPASCAVVEDGKLIAEYFMNVKLTHSQTLMPMVDSMLKSLSLSYNDLDVFAVANGPGSFTGIRIGISAIKGLVLPLNKPCAGISTLEAMAYCAAVDNGILCACMDARCNQVYNALFLIKNGKLQRICDDRALMVDALIKEILEMQSKNEYNDLKIYVTGDGAEIFMSTAEKVIDNICVVSENVKYQRASGVAFVAEQVATHGGLVSSNELLPCYLRLPQAERELKRRNEIEQVVEKK